MLAWEPSNKISVSILGMRRSAVWDALAGRQVPSLQLGGGGGGWGQEGRWGDLFLPAEASLVPLQAPITGLGQPQHQCTQAAPETPAPGTGASDLLTAQLASNTRAFGSFCVMFGAVIASDNRYCNTALNDLERTHGRCFVPVSVPGGSQLAGNGANAVGVSPQPPAARPAARTGSAASQPRGQWARPTEHQLFQKKVRFS